MKTRSELIQNVLSLLIALIWFINGLLCKVLNLVPRHEQIISRILGDQYSYPFTKIIGLSEILMSIWIFSRIRSRSNAIIQIIVIATMNIIEFILAPDLLLWGRLNSFFAFTFIIIIYYNEFILNKKQPQQT